MDPAGEHGRTRLDALEDAHRSAFTAFARPVNEADRRAAIAVAGHNIGPSANPEHARRVYEGPEGTIDLVPGRGSIACVAIQPSGEHTSGESTIELAVKDGCGYISRTRSPDSRAPEVTLIGVIPAGASDLAITTTSGTTTPVRLTPDGAYWITTHDAQDLYWTRPDGTIHQHAFGRLHVTDPFTERDSGRDKTGD